MTAPPTTDNTAFTTRVEVRAQSMFLAFLVVAQVGMWWQVINLTHVIGDVNAGLNRDVGSLSANVATLTELARDHTSQLRDLDHRMTAIETQLRALTDAVTRLAPPKP